MAADQSSERHWDHEARLRGVFDAAVDAIVTIDERGTVETCNPATERIFGYRPDELIGQNVSILMPAPQREEHDRYLRQYLETGEKKIIGIGREVMVRHKDGTLIPVDLAVSEVVLGSERMFTGILRDLRDKKRAEVRMLQAERLAAIGQMVAGLAHESRNALQRSQACLEMLELELEDQPEALHFVRRIEQAQDDLRRLFEEVRSYAAPLAMEVSEGRLSRVWKEAWSSLAAQRAGRDAQLDERCEGVNLACQFDEFRLVQLFRNLLENSLAACPDPVRITIRCRQTMLEGEEAIEVRVRDNGPGLTDEQRQQVFEPFYTTKTKGTGLGMAIARRIIEAHHGTIEAGSPAGPGAEFVITLPRHHDHAAP